MSNKLSGIISEKQKSGKTLLGTFAGVFTPSILTVLGVIMYLRMGWVVGNVGITNTLIIVTLSTSITFLTALSIAAIATNQFVKTGGAYYMISRSLGIEVGGAIGIPLYFAQTFSVALYTIGFAESFANTFPQFNQTSVGIIVTVFIAGLALISTKLAVRSQFFILAAIVISLISLLFGKPLEDANVVQTMLPKEGFWTVFAVFFPAVTGIMVGVNMSGDLKNPVKSIPRGTFLAVGAGYIVYMILPVILYQRADTTSLIEDPLIMKRISWWGNAILLGVWGATLSSALGSIMGAPRVLQAMVFDNIFPKWLRWLGISSKKGNIPRNGTAFTLVIVLTAVYFGNLNLIAPILSMFFLSTYALLNISAGLEKLLDSPSFRPSFKVHWVFSFLGAFGCIAVMLLINPLATFIAFVVVVLVFVMLEKRKLSASWGDLRQGMVLGMIRYGLMHLKKTMDPKNWRPHLLVLSGAPTKRWHLIALANSLVQNRGIMTVSTILTDQNTNTERRSGMEEQVLKYLKVKGINCLVRVINATDTYSGAIKLSESYGLGNLVPNTVMLGSTERKEHHDDFARMISYFHESRKNIIVVKFNENRQFGRNKRIDLWLRGIRYNGALMIILAYLMQHSIPWYGAQIVIRMIVKDKEARQELEENLLNLTKNFRMKLNISVMLSEGKSFEQIAHEKSSDADLMILGLATPGENFIAYYQDLTEKIKDLPTTMFVLASQDMKFEEILK
ncbi:MAG: amino acid permease [Bacteroidales bacterium]|nr:amino acid permease [Bacteroidales bacterium]MCF8388376.1 amino acid permease [Bacteroidales bacterium]MCF8396533.1 amino acid permease [Bacteroidales bacterium]